MVQIMNSIRVLIIMIGVLLVIGAALIIFFILNMKNKKMDSSQDMSSAKRIDVREILPIEDIRDDMIIERGGNRFSAVISCTGNAFYNKPREERVAIQNNYVDFIFAIKEPIMFRQYGEGVNVDYTIKKYESAYKSIEQTLFNKMETFKENQKLTQELAEKNDPELEQLLTYMEEEKEAIECLQWRLQHIKDEENYLNYHSYATSGSQKRMLTYVVSWSPSGNIAISTDKDTIYETAKQELDRLCKVKIRQLSGTGTSSRRCTTKELIDICRRHSSPVSANRYTMSDILSSTYFDDISTTPVLQERNEQFKDYMIDKVLSGGS